MDFIVKEANNSRFPVYEEDIDNIVGVLHMRDVLYFAEQEEYLDRPISQIDGLLRSAHFAPEAKNINALLGTSAYARLRFGIGNDFLKGQQIDYVLGTWQGEEAEKLPALLERGGEINTSFVLQGIIRTMNTFNTDRK